MKKFAIIALAGLASTVSAEGFYLRGNLGGSTVPEDMEFSGKKIEVDSGLLVGFALGYQVSPNFAVEGDVRYRGLGVDKSWGNTSLETDFDMMSYMVNGVYEFDLESARPYVKAGLGFATVSSDGKTTVKSGNTTTIYQFSEESDTNVAWSVGTGVNFQLDKAWQMGLDYQYLSAGDLDFSSENDKKAKLDAQSHELSLGVRYNF